MKKTKKQPVIIDLTFPDGTRLEASIPLWKAYAVMADLEREELLKDADKKNFNRMLYKNETL